MPKIDVSENAFEYLKSRAEPFVDTTATVLDRIIAEVQSIKSNPLDGTKDFELRFSGGELPSVKFATILRAEIDRTVPKTLSWNHLLEEMIAKSCQKSGSAEHVRSVLQANTVSGNQSDNGYRFVAAAGFSFQGLEANRVCKNLAVLAATFGIPVNIKIRWQGNEKAAFPGQEARLVFP